MGDPFKKVLHGQRLEIAADAYNAFLDSASVVRGRRHDAARDTTREFRQSGIIRVRNGTGQDVPRFGVLALGQPVIQPGDSLQEFKNQVAFEGAKPGNAPRRDRFAIAMEPLAIDAMGRGIVAGVTPVQVEVIREDDGYADAVAGEMGFLRSAPGGLTRILWKESGLGIKWGIVRLSERPQFAIFELSGQWVAAASPEPDGWARMDSCRPVCFVEDDGNYVAASEHTPETIWHLAGYPPAERAALIALHKSTGRFPTKYGAGDWVWCHWNEQEGRWQILGAYEDHWRFKLLSDLSRFGSAQAQLILHDGSSWAPVALTFLVHDSLGLAGCDCIPNDSEPSVVPAGKWGVARRFADSGKWEVLALDHGCSADPSVVTFQETDVCCEADRLHVYKRAVTLTLQCGRLTKDEGTWHFSHRAGCCGCREDGSGELALEGQSDVAHQSASILDAVAIGDLALGGQAATTHTPATVYSAQPIGDLATAGTSTAALSSPIIYPAGAVAIEASSNSQMIPSSQFGAATSGDVAFDGSAATSLFTPDSFAPASSGVLALEGQSSARCEPAYQPPDEFPVSPSGDLGLAGESTVVIEP